MMKSVLSLVLVVSGAAACASVPPPAALNQVDAARQGAAAVEAKLYAHGAYEHAEKLRRDANAAWSAGDHSGAQALAERAIAAYSHALSLARIVRADSEGREANAKLAAAEKELGLIAADQARVSAEADALELRVKVARDAAPVVPSGPADAAREKARLAAARALALDARVLCSAAKLLAASLGGTADPPKAARPAGEAKLPADPAAVGLESATAALSKLEADLASPAGRPGPKGPAPIDQATRVRAGCLAALTTLRRAATPVSRAPGAGDALLSELSASGKFTPSRDDRGVFVTLRDVFRGAALTAEGEARLAELGRVAQAHPSFPTLVVLHHDREPSSKDQPELGARADAVVKALKAAGAPSAEAVLAGAASPLVDPAGKDRARNARLEIVFVTPETY